MSLLRLYMQIKRMNFLYSVMLCFWLTKFNNIFIDFSQDPNVECLKFTYFSTLVSKFGENSREFSKSESKVHYLVLFNPNNLDTFIFISIHEEKRRSVSFNIHSVLFDNECRIKPFSSKLILYLVVHPSGRESRRQVG